MLKELDMYRSEDVKTWYKTANEEDRQLFRDWLRGVLRNMDVKITFTKKDGTNRIINCTLREGVVPIYEKKTDNVRDVNSEVCPVFDIDKQEFRSFRFDSVTNIEFTL
jgi:hypothetical protein